MKHPKLYQEALSLLQALIATKSYSKEEDQTALLMEAALQEKGVKTHRAGNNIWAFNQCFDASKPSILLNSHHDTVKPNKAYTNDPFEAKIEEGKLYGLGSNDAGGCLVALMSLFLYFYEKEDLVYNLVFLASAEEENSGLDGIRSVLDQLPAFDFALIGEPTQMQMAVAEKGLLVIDGHAAGISGHAAHDNTENAIYNALEDINWIRQYEFPKSSELLGKVKLSVTQINAGEQHNVVPAACHFVIDARVNEHYSNQIVFETLQAHTKSELKARSFRLSSSSIEMENPLVQAGLILGVSSYGSPTLSDQSALSCPSLKMGPGNSTRSHTADEFLYLEELETGIEQYIELFSQIL